MLVETDLGILLYYMFRMYYLIYVVSDDEVLP